MDKKLIKGEYLDTLLRSSQTIFSTKDVALLWGGAKENIISVRLSKYVKAGKLIRVRRGIYVKDKNYDKYELATKILRPAYVSFETILRADGLTFQYYSQIFIASYVTRDIICDSQKYSFVQMKNSILANPLGIEHDGEYSRASKERAFLDTIYRSGGYYFDNLSPLDWDKVFEMIPLYNDKKMIDRVQEHFEYYKANK